jgi:hypothetical protein
MSSPKDKENEEEAAELVKVFREGKSEILKKMAEIVTQYTDESPFSLELIARLAGMYAGYGIIQEVLKDMMQKNGTQAPFDAWLSGMKNLH